MFQQPFVTLDHLYLAVVLKDISGCRQVKHSVDHQLTVASKLIAPLLKESYLHLLILN